MDTFCYNKEERMKTMSKENLQYYNPLLDKKMMKQHLAAQRKCFQYNNMDPKEREERDKIIKELFQSIGEDFMIEQPLHCDYGYNITIGKKFYANYNLTILDTAKITIGDHVFIGPNCNIFAAIHPLDIKRRNQDLEAALPVTIGNNVWLGGNVTILPGVTIGDNTTIGAGSVVTKDIPNSVVAAGNPAKIIKKL